VAYFTLGSFNCKWGSFRNDKRKGEADREKNNNIKRVIEDNKLQILALQEYWVEKNIDNKVAESLLSTVAPSHWKIEGYPVDTPIGRKSGIEFSEEKTDEFTEQIYPKQVNNGYAILWNTDYFEKKDSDEWQKYSNKILHQINQGGRIIRYPQIFRLQPKIPRLPKFEIRIINIHLTYSGEGKTYYIRKRDRDELEKMLISYGPSMYIQEPETKPRRWQEESPKKIWKQLPEKIVRRQEELDLCLDIYNKVDSYSEDGIIPYTILVGDFNLDPGSCKKILNEATYEDRHKEKREYILKMEEKTTLRKKLGYDPYSQKYDHFIADQRGGKLKNEERIDTLKYFDYNNELHYRELSDHVPIITKISLT
jgi:hypothetical protein